MTSLLVNHILQTEKWTSPELFETKNRIYKGGETMRVKVRSV